MVSLFGKILKLFPWLGALLVVAAVALSLHRGYMGHGSLALVVIGFVLILTIFLKVEAASLRYYLNLTIIAALLLGNLTVIYLLTANRDQRWDLTQGNRYSLYPQTRYILENLKAPVQIDVKAIENEPWRSYFLQYERLSPQIRFTITNPYAAGPQDKGPDSEVKLNDIIVSSGDRQTRIRFDAEADVEEIGHKLESRVASAILRVIQSRDVRVYFVSRHGEKTPEHMAGEHGKTRSINQFAEFLAKRAMSVRILDLQADRMVPDDCSVLAILGPLSDYSVDEIEAVRRYLKKGGALLAMLDPPLEARQRLPRLRALLAEWGIDAKDQVVVDYDSYSAQHNVLVPLVHDFNPIHPITENLQGAGEDMPLTVVGPIDKAPQTPEGMSYAALIQTSAKGAALDMNQYMDMLQTKKLRLPPSSTWHKVPLALAAEGRPAATAGVAAQRKALGPFPRIAAFGDSDFLTDAQLGPMQSTLGYFTFNWLAGESDLIRLPPPRTAVTPIVLKPNQRNLISIVTVVILPFAIFFGGLAYTTIRRRKR